MNLTEMILCSRDNDKNFDDIYFRFKKKIEFLVESFNIKLYKNDVILFLWQLTKKINVSNFKSEQMLQAYISVSLKNYCISIYNKHCKNNKIIYNSVLTNIEIDQNYNDNSIEDSSLAFDDLIINLSDKQKEVITMRYKYCLSDDEIARSLNISRQAVYKNRIAALNKLHETLSC
ncbi:sigma factor-like helix-turn-helix DNA-binding protein [Inconstantimicrobium mannanitabidum]|uniref:Transcriptional regulator BotR, P-21 n=1 Tax=Inconstantimicrobium mannanitabidum TaxID=1604901 RepID=A0ACB5RGY1_9CLOT|nr:sigma factor-like helix-turn-helix DNA-binding protein [Clostridium sp. TW13]GKX68350.1 transcriptional regulator BotR, P-21 [Clostridium sp. TW13]